jgi:hypothetical protein
MSAQTTNEGVNKLAQAMQSRMHGVNGLSQQPLDFGEIQGDMSLLTNRFPLPIPQSDYMVCRSLTWGDPGSALTNTMPKGGAEDVSGGGEHTHPGIAISGDHVHTVRVGDKLRSVAPGDRVLVAWVGDDACVIDTVYPAARI